jgi:glycerol uptake facilitator-like aquaporin
VTPPLTRRLLAEFLGSAFLAALVIGSGIAGQQLSHDTGLQLLENAAATAAGLFAIILMFGPASGGHFNPVVSLVDAAFGGLSRRDTLAYMPAQIAGCITGAVAANAMFAPSAISISTHHRASPSHLFAEVIATPGLLLVIFALARSGRSSTAPAAVGAYIGAAYWFTSSTSFANRAISVGRRFSDAFAGIAPASLPTFVSPSSPAASSPSARCGCFTRTSGPARPLMSWYRTTTVHRPTSSRNRRAADRPHGRAFWPRDLMRAGDPALASRAVSPLGFRLGATGSALSIASASSAPWFCDHGLPP